MVKNIIAGAVGGAVAAFVGWAKNRDIATDKQEEFDFKYLIQTVFIGAVLGALSVFDGIKMDSAQGVVTQTGACASGVVFGEMILKAIWRQGVPRIKDLVAHFKKA